MKKRYCLVQGGFILSTILWDGNGELPLDAGVTLMLESDALTQGLTVAPDLDATTRSNESALNDQLSNSLANLRAYIALTSPTAAQNTAAIKLLCRVAVALIRVQLRRLDATD